MKISTKQIVIGSLFLTMGLFVAMIVIFGVIHAGLDAGVVVGSICALFWIVLSVMVILDGIGRKRKIARIRRTGALFTGRIFQIEKETGGEILLVVRFFDETGCVVCMRVPTDMTAKEEFPTGSDVTFRKEGNFAIFEALAGYVFSEEEAEKLARANGMRELAYFR